MVCAKVPSTTTTARVRPRRQAFYVEELESGFVGVLQVQEVAPFGELPFGGVASASVVSSLTSPPPRQETQEDFVGTAVGVT